MLKAIILSSVLIFLSISAGAHPLVQKDTTIKFLWVEYRYWEDLKDTFRTIIINEDYCKVISEPNERQLLILPMI